MKISFKTISNKTFTLDLEPTDTVKAVKEKILETQGSGFPVENTLIIYQGKVLKEETTLEENNVAENTFFVVMVQKAKVAAPAAPVKAPQRPATSPSIQQAPTDPTSGPAVAGTPEHPPSGTPVASTAPAAAAPQPATAVGTPAPAATGQPGTGTPDNSSSTLVTGAQLEESIANIIEMGFPRDQVILAMRAAFNNPERAVEYLMNGIPANIAPPPMRAPRPPPGAPLLPIPGPPPPPGIFGSQPPAAANAPSTGPNARPLDMFAPPGSAERGPRQGPLAFLANHPQFQQLRAVVQSNPNILHAMIQELAKSNPQLIQLINENQEEFMRMINEPVDPAVMEEVFGAAGAAGVAGQEEDVDMGEDLTEDEQAVVGRLEALGFPRGAVVEAYLVCGKNEELAANYLLEHGNDDML